VEHHKGSEARQSAMPATRKTAENGFKLPTPADRWIQAKPNSRAYRPQAAAIRAALVELPADGCILDGSPTSANTTKR
jgi:hypothetical protein